MTIFKKLISSWLISLALLCLGWSVISAQASDIGPKSTIDVAAKTHLFHRVLVLSQPADTSLSANLSTALVSHLAGQGIVVTVVEIDPMPEDRAAQADIARNKTTNYPSDIVVWFDFFKGSFLGLVVAKNSPEGLIDRPLNSPPSKWPSMADALATCVYSALSPVIAVVSSDEQRPSSETSEEISKDVALQSRQTTKPDEQPPTKHNSFYSITELGYGLHMVNSVPDVQHGFRLAFGNVLFRHFEMLTRMDLLFPLAANGDTGSSDITLVRFPLFFGGGAFFTIKNKFNLGIRMGFVLDIGSIKGLDKKDLNYGEEPKNTSYVNPGFSPGIIFKLRLTPAVAVFLSTELAFYRYEYSFEMNENIILRSGGLNSSFNAGFAFSPWFQ